VHHRFKAAALLCLALATSIPARPAEGAAYCAVRAHAEVAIAPPELRPAIIQTFHITGAPMEGLFVRCVGPRLLASSVGANLNCGKADTRQSRPEVAEYCHEHPGAVTVPMFVTGHSTIYWWKCLGDKPVAHEAFAVDAQGFIANNWKMVP